MKPMSAPAKPMTLCVIAPILKMSFEEEICRDCADEDLHNQITLAGHHRHSPPEAAASTL
jgi:hypothetical protein